MIQLFSWSLQASTEVLKQRHQDLDQQLAVWMPLPPGVGVATGWANPQRRGLAKPHPSVQLVTPHPLKGES